MTGLEVPPDFNRVRATSGCGAMTALVLGLVTASAKSSFDTVDATVRHAAMNVLDLDRLLARYGPETQEMRAALRRFVEMRADMIWPRDGLRASAAGARGRRDQRRGARRAVPEPVAA